MRVAFGRLREDKTLTIAFGWAVASALRSAYPTLSSRPEQIIANAVICGVEGPAVVTSPGRGRTVGRVGVNGTKSRRLAGRLVSWQSYLPQVDRV